MYKNEYGKHEKMIGHGVSFRVAETDVKVSLRLRRVHTLYMQPLFGIYLVKWIDLGLFLESITILVLCWSF